MGGVLSAAYGDEPTEVVELAPVLVTASPFVTDLEELVVPTSKLDGDELSRAAVSSLGASLEGQPGVHSTYFGPGAGRPVIRGFDGDRVRILNQGTDSFDVSQTSPDHGVSIEPLFAERIEVVRGPASLLYGNAAIGGVVNVIGKEIPRERLNRKLTGEVQASYGSASDEKTAGVALQRGQGDFAWSFGYLNRSSGDLEIPSFAESVYQIEAEEHDEHEHEEHEEGEHEEGEHEEEEHEEEVFGVLENSFVDTRTGYFGGTWFGDRGSLGISFSRYETDYGVPGHAHSHEEEHHEEEGHEEEEHAEEEESVAIDLDQTRLSVHGTLIEPFVWFESLEVDLSVGDYRHRELEGDEVGTIFNRDGFEFRATGVHRPIGNLAGAVGLQVKDESFSAIGEEAFIPDGNSAQYGLFAVERLDQEWGAWEFGGRIEQVDVNPVDDELASRRFTVGAASAGLIRRIGESTILSANLTYAERAPNVSELYAFGPHVGTQSFEVGNASLGLESSTNLDLSYRLVAGKLTGEVTLFHSDFSDYVYKRFLDETEAYSVIGDTDTDGLDVYQATAVDAHFYGYEIDLRYQLLAEAERSMYVSFLVDQTKAINETADLNLPRIPTRRVGGRFQLQQGPLTFGIEGRHHTEASNLAPDELPTDSYFLWGADLRYRIQSTDTVEMDLVVIGTNLGDEEARSHVSFLKDLAPLPGRSIRLGVETRF